jgi:hypothetical protein
MHNAGKAIFAFLYAVAAIAVPLFGGGGKPGAEGWVQIGIAVVTAASVYIAPLIPEAPWTKTIVGVLLAALQVLTTAVINGVDSADMLVIAFAIAGALGIVVAPATSANGVHVGWGSDNYALAA